MVYASHGIFGLIVVHCPQRQIQRVCTDVHQRPAALLLCVQEHAPCRHGTAPQRLGLRIIDLAQAPLLALRFQELAVRTVSVLVGDRKKPACLAGRVQHFFAFRIIDGHRLFAHHMLAAMQRVHRDKRMRAVGRTHIHHVQLLRQQLLVIRVYPDARRAVFRSCLFGPFPDDVTECDHFHAVHFPNRRQMLVVCNAPASDDSCFDFHFCFPLNHNRRIFSECVQTFASLL